MKNMMIIIIVLLSTVCSVSASDDNDDKSSYSDEVCVPESEFNIGGIDMNFSKEAIITAKGEPLKIEAYPDEYVEVLFYIDTTIYVFSGDHVFELSTTSPDNKTPSGISVGMTKKEVMKIIGYKDYSNWAGEEQIPICNKNEMYYLLLTFDEKYILTKLGMGYDLP